MGRIIITSPQASGSAVLELRDPEIRGWWSSRESRDKKYRIKRARLGEVVYFIVETKGIPDKAELNLRLYQLETLLWLDYLKPDKYQFGGKEKSAVVTISNHEGIIKLALPQDWSPEVQEEHIELYWRTKYCHYPEKHLPDSKDDYLSVFKSDRTLFILPSKIDSNFPELYAADGSLLVVTVVTGVHDMAEESIKTVVSHQIGKIALTKLEKGYMVDNYGKIYGPVTRDNLKRPLVDKEVYTSEGILVSTRQGRNFTGPEGATTKGINQYEHFATQGSKVKLLGLMKKTNLIFNALDVVDIMNLGMNEDKGELPLTSALGMIANAKYNEMQAAFDDEDQRQLAGAKGQGLKAAKAWVNSYGGDKYNLVAVPKETAIKILTGEIRTLEDFYSERFGSGEINVLYKLQSTNTIIIETFFIE